MTWLVLLASLLGAENPALPRAVDFDTQVAPVFSKAGCNAAACHGAAEGRGGFKLSLFGGDPKRDYQAIVREREGRRIRFDRPWDSLLLAKPLGQIDHEGGVRFEADSPQARTLAQWIAAGARRDSSRKLHRIEVSPQRIIASEEKSSFSIRVSATFQESSGKTTVEDVTRSAVIEPADPSAVSIADNGQATVHRPGLNIVVVRFLSEVLTVQIIAPVNAHSVEPALQENSHWIDREIDALLKQLRIPHSPMASDAELLRRVTLDLTGRLPTVAEAKAYLAESSPEKYQRLLDRLLTSEAFNDFWCYRLSGLFRVGANVRESEPIGAYSHWIRSQLAEERSYAELVAELVMSQGDSHEVGPANFYRTASGARAQAEFVSEVLMGVRLRCANCHNHPLDHWTQDDYHGLSALFAPIEAGRIVRWRKGRSVMHPSTGEAARPRIPGERFLAEPLGDEDYREDFANWLTTGDNPYFARAIVNRLWKSLMGRGLVEPLDDLRQTNPPTHPELLKRLEREFVEGGFRLRPLLRTIAMSQAYRRSGRTVRGNQNDDRFYSKALIKPLEAEVLADAIADVTGVPEDFPEVQDGLRAVQLSNPRTPSETLDVLGRCDRQQSCEPYDAPLAGGLSTRLHLINGKLLNAKLRAPEGALRRAIASGRSTTDIVAEFYWSALSRPPLDEEASFWAREIQEGPERVEAMEDFAWSLLSSSAFTKNH